jgi:DNA-binding protein HU-beta
VKKIVDLSNANRVGKQFLIDSLVESNGFSRSDATEAVNGVLDALFAALSSGVNVSISNVGTFRRETTPATTRRNPQTGERFPVEAQEVVRWTSSPTLLDVLNGRAHRSTISTKAPKGTL